MDSSYGQTSFLGGEISKAAQGRFDLPWYRTALNTCLNMIPVENGSLVRRPGTQFLQTTRGGNPGRLIKFDIQANNPYNLEFTDGFLRFFDGPNLVTTNDAQVVTAISAASPAEITTTTAHGWTTGDQVLLSNLGLGTATLQNRVFSITVTSSTKFTIKDAITLASINGALLTFTTGSVSRVLQLTTTYVATSWQNVRSVQAETNAILLNATIQPQILSVTALPVGTLNATFSLGAAIFLDGPYLDPVTGGATLTPSAITGLITATIAFPAYDATVAYKLGDFVFSAGQNYKSLLDQNLNNTPASSPTSWLAVSAGLAVGPNGFVGTDVGRLIRLFSEPPLWAGTTTTYAAGNVVAYPNGVNGGVTYWTALTAVAASASAPIIPGTNLTAWAINSAGALWSWGKITALANIISGTLANTTHIGTLTQGGGLAAAFDSNTNKATATCASFDAGISVNDSYIGQDYHLAAAQKIASATAFPSTDNGFAIGFGSVSGISGNLVPQVVLNLRAKTTLPASGSDGTLLGTTGVLTNLFAPASIQSSDTTTAWNYVWIEIISTITIAAVVIDNRITIAQAQFFSSVAGGGGGAVTLQILGPKLLYTSAVRTWRLGLYSNTTGWPSCGTYHEGRVWFSGAVTNRIDSSQTNPLNPILGQPQYINMAPTQPDGTVTAQNGISYIFNAPDVNQIFWMEPDLQGIICGTQAGEWLVQATTQNLPLSATNIQAHRVTKIKCANIEPRRCDHTITFVQLEQRKVIEYFADVYSGKLSGPDISKFAKHVTRSGLVELAYQQEISPILWARLSNNALIGCSYSREVLSTAQTPTFFGWHRHTLGSNRVVESIVVGPGAGVAATLMMVTNDLVSNIRHVEMLTPVFEEGNDLSSAWFLDDAITPSSTVLSTMTVTPYGGLQLNGLWHLNGKTVSVFAGGLDCGDFLVTSGSTIVPFGDGISGGTASGQFTQTFVSSFTAGIPIVVGFTYTSQGQTVRPALPAESGARNGPATGKKRRTHKYTLITASTSGLSIGTVFTKLNSVLFKSDAGVIMPVGQTFTGVYKETLNDDYSYDSMLALQISRPLPAIIASVGAYLHTQDE